MSRIAKELAERQGSDSLRKLARDLDVAVGTAEGWVKGWRTPDIENIPKIAEYLGESANVVVEWVLADLPATGAKKGLSRAPIIHGMTSPWAVRPTDNRPAYGQAA